MAYLKDLIVSGSSRFLNKAYINDAEISTLNVTGTATFDGNLETEGTLNVGKTTSENAIIYLNNKLAIKGKDAWLRINEGKPFTSGVFFGSSVLRTDGSYQIGASGASINMSSTSAIFNVPITSSTSITNNGSLTNNGNIYNTKGTIETDIIKANVWDIVSTQNMGGNFYVCPTIMVKDGSTFYISSVSGTSITGYIIDSTNITSADFAGHTWSQNSKIKITGKLTSGTNTYVLGVCDGTLTAAMDTTANRINFTITCNASTVPPAGTYTISDGTVMMYSVGASNAVGIHMTSYGTNKYTYIDIYNGANGATPMARIGKLDGLAAINGVNPTGYGIYTTNGYFQGLIVANAGKIGGWTIGDSYITTNTNRTTYNATTAGLTITSSGIGAGNGSLNTFYVNSSGNFMAQAGTIGGFTITTKSLYSGTYGAASSVFITTNFEGNAVAIGGSSAINTWRIGAGSKFGVNSNGTVYASDIQASGGKIGGSTITSSSIYGNNRSAYNSGTGYYLGSDGKFGVGTSANYVTFDGTNLNIRGNVYLSNGTSVENKIAEEISNIEVGGRNLLLNTGNETASKLIHYYTTTNGGASNYSLTFNNGETTLTSTSASGEHFVRFCLINPANNVFADFYPTGSREWVFSGYVKSSFADESSYLSVRVQEYDASAWHNGLYLTNLITGEEVDIYTGAIKILTGSHSDWVRFAVKVTILDDVEITAGYISFQQYGTFTVGDTFSYKQLKFELGNKATDWTPAPEDAINNLEIGGRNLLRGSETMALWSKASGTTILNSIATLTGSSSNWNGVLNTSKFNASLYDGTTTYVWSFEYKSTAACTITHVISGTAESINTTSWARTKYVYWGDNFTLPSSGGEWRKYVFAPRTIALSDLTSGSGDVVSGYLQLYARTDNVSIQVRHMKLEKGNKSTDWSPAPEDAEVEIGGRNLVKGTAKMISGTASFAGGKWRASGGATSNPTGATLPDPRLGGYIRSTNTGSSASQCGLCQDNVPSLITGQIYTMSFWIRASVAGLTIKVQPAWKTSSQYAMVENAGTTTTSWQRITATAIIGGTQSDTYSAAYVYAMALPAGEWFEVCGMKLEKGNTATDWTPAPEDLEERVTAAELKITDSAIVSTVTSSTTYQNNLNNITNKITANGTTGTNLLQDVYAPGISTKVNAKYPRYFSNAANATTTVEYVNATSEVLPDPNASGFARITNTELGKSRGVVFYNCEAWENAIGLVLGQTYKASCWVRQLSGGANFAIQTIPSINYSDHTFIPSSKWERYEMFFTYTEYNETGYYYSTRLFFNNQAGSNSSASICGDTGIGQIDMCGYRLEQVNAFKTTGRNLCLRSKSYEGWGTNNGTTFVSDSTTDKIVFPTVTTAAWREAWQNNNIPYSIVRNQRITITFKVKGEVVDGVGNWIAVNICPSVVADETSNVRLKYINKYATLRATGDWQTVCMSMYVNDAMFYSLSNTPDYDNCYFHIRVGARSDSTYGMNGFEMKEIMVALGSEPCVWSEAPEDLEDVTDRLAGEISSMSTDLSSLIEQLPEKIESTVTGKYYTVTDAQEYISQQISTKVTQLQNAVNIDFHNVRESISSVDGTVNKNQETLTKYIRFVDGNIVLGNNEANSTVLQIENTQMVFKKNNDGNNAGDIIAYFSTDGMKVPQGSIVTIGDFQFVPRSNGSLDFKKA